LVVARPDLGERLVDLNNVFHERCDFLRLLDVLYVNLHGSPRSYAAREGEQDPGI
jgi:hypothetical protein